MKKLIYIISTILCSIALITITNARVVRNSEYVTKREARQYFASASELLESFSDPYKNPRLLRHLENNEGIRKIKEETQWIILHPRATSSNGISGGGDR